MNGLELFISKTKLNGLGHGSGCGYDCGNGYGYGDGHGIGDGSGFRDSCGMGYGDGSGHCSEYGCGCGYADDQIYGYAHGWNDSNDVLAFNGQKALLIDGLQTVICSEHGNYARCLLLNNDLSTTPVYLAIYNNCVSHGETLHEAVEDAKNKFVKAHSEKERIKLFITTFPDINQEVDGEELFKWHGLLTLSCKAGRETWCRQNKINPASIKMTVKQFFEMTKDSYGSEIIKKVMKAYKKKK